MALRAQELEKSGNLQEAADVYRQAVLAAQRAKLEKENSLTQSTDQEKNKSLSAWHMGEADKAFQSGSYLEGFLHAQRATELDPPNKEAVKLARKLKIKFDEERRVITQKKLLLAQAEEARLNGKLRLSMEFLKKAKKLSPDDEEVKKAIDSLNSKNPSEQTSKKHLSYESIEFKKPIVEEYKVSPGDVIEVFVWQNPDLSRDVIVRPDGKVSFPLAGDMDASGLTLTQVDEAITKRLRTYIRFPDVSLAIKRFGGTKTLILGEVLRPGVYIPAGQGRILELIAMAAGFTPVANQRNVILIRGGLASPEIFKLDLESALKQGNLADNMMLQPDDIVYVPKSGISSVLDFMEQFYPTINQVLVGQAIAKNFGFSTTISGDGEAE